MARVTFLLKSRWWFSVGAGRRQWTDYFNREYAKYNDMALSA